MPAPPPTYYKNLKKRVGDVLTDITPNLYCQLVQPTQLFCSANMITVALGTKTDNSIFYPSSYNSVVGFKPTVGLTSRAGIVPVGLR
ncbi:hypothetical protein COP1_034143 [Malus domestica]